MKNLIVIYAMLLSVACQAETMFVASNVHAFTLDGLEILLNGRPFTSGKVNRGGMSFAGPVSECIKAGTNVLSVKVLEQATEEMRAAVKAKKKEQAKVRLDLVRRKGEAPAERIFLVNETFTNLPTNFVFTVTDDWPIKNLVWVGKTPKLTEKDKAEIVGILTELAQGFASIDSVESQRRIWQLKLLVSEHEALLKGKALEDYRKQCFETYSKAGDLFTSEELHFDHADFIAYPGYNLVRVVSGGSAMKLAVFNVGSRYLNAPEWFSKIDGKWCIVP